MNRIFADYGIYISIMYAENLDKDEAWVFSIHEPGLCLHTSGRIFGYNECQVAAIKKAAEYLEL